MIKALLVSMLVIGCSVDAAPFGGADFGDASLARGDAGMGGAAGSLVLGTAGDDGTAGAIGTSGVVPVASGGTIASTGGATPVSSGGMFVSSGGTIGSSGGATVSPGGTIGSSGGAAVGTGGMVGSGGTIGTGGSHYIVSGLGGAPPGVPSSMCNGDLSWNDSVPQDGRHRPGSACMSCHASFTVMGTVYRDAKAATNCYGVGADKSVFVLLVDADGKSVGVKPNEAGNFYTQEPLRFPIMASTIYGSGQAMMQAKIEAGPLGGSDCNSCHTDGKRITPP